MRFERKLDSYPIVFEAVFMGDDLCLCVFGGDTPHIGAVTLSIPRASLRDPSALSASTSVLTVTGHKEDELARDIGGKLAALFNCRVAVCCGIHFDNASPEQILSVEKLTGELLLETIDAILAQRKPSRPPSHL